MTTSVQSWPGYAATAGSYEAPPVRRTSPTRLLVRLGIGVAVLIVAVVAVTTWLTPAAPKYVCPPDCGEPPMGKPVDRLPRFTPANGEFSVAYPGEGTAYKVSMQPDGVSAEFTGGDGGTLQLIGQPAAGRTPQDIARSLIDETYPEADKDYEIPNAMVGYHLGYGEVDDFYPQDAAGKYTRLRILVMVAVKNDLALIAAAIGPYHQFTPQFSTGQPSAANLQIALDMGKYVNSFMWRADPPR